MNFLKTISVIILLTGSLFGCLVLFTVLMCGIANDWQAFSMIWEGVNLLMLLLLFIGALVMYITISIIQYWKQKKEEYEEFKRK